MATQSSSKDGKMEVTGFFVLSSLSSIQDISPTKTLGGTAAECFTDLSRKHQAAFDLGSAPSIARIDVYLSTEAPDNTEPLNALAASSQPHRKCAIMFELNLDSKDAINKLVEGNKEIVAHQRANRLIEEEEEEETNRESKESKKNVKSTMPNPVTPLLPEAQAVSIVRQEMQQEMQEFTNGINSTVAKLTASNDKLTASNTDFKLVVDHLTKLVNVLTPIHLRVLLDLSRQKVLQVCELNDWETLRGNKTLWALQGFVYASVPNLTSGAVNPVCGYNNVRHAGNHAAHTATKEDPRDAAEKTKEKRGSLEELFELVYGEKF